MNHQISMRDKLVDQGEKLFQSPKQVIQFTENTDADALLNDLDDYPHAFVLACVMDRQVKAEKAWLIPHKIANKLNNEFSMDILCGLSLDQVKKLMKEPAPLHRFVDNMSELFFSAVQRIRNQYREDASGIWRGQLSSAEIVYRFLEFDGVGPKIGNMAANILARDFKIPFADYYSIDISADVHVRRVFSRLGFCGPNATIEQVIYKARSLHPEFPGMMDLPCWEIGRKWCKSHDPKCNECYMQELCLNANQAEVDR